MTGFGRSVVDGEKGSQGAQARWVIEVRSVNHRGFDLKIRSPDVDPGIEAEIARAVRSVVERGTVTVAVREEHTLPAGLDLGRVRELLSTLEKIRLEAGIPTPAHLCTVPAFPAGDPNPGGSGAPRRARGPPPPPPA